MALIKVCLVVIVFICINCRPLLLFIQKFIILWLENWYLGRRGNFVVGTIHFSVGLAKKLKGRGQKLGRVG